VALVPIQFREAGRAPLLRRAEGDDRFEQGAGYLSPADFDVNGRVIGGPGAFLTPLVWSPGYSCFTGLFTSSKAGSATGTVYLEILDPFTQIEAWGPILAPGLIVTDDTDPVFMMGTTQGFGTVFGRSNSDFVWLLWRFWIINTDATPTTFSLEMVANSRLSR
jgi:hypothetical protein